jgi:hypothetical protein
MTIPMIFDDFTRTEGGPSPRSMSNFAFLNRSARKEAYRARDVIQKWIECYPKAHREKLIKNLRSDDDLTHQGAFLN